MGFPRLYTSSGMIATIPLHATCTRKSCRGGTMSRCTHSPLIVQTPGLCGIQSKRPVGFPIGRTTQMYGANG